MEKRGRRDLQRQDVLADRFKKQGKEVRQDILAGRKNTKGWRAYKGVMYSLKKVKQRGLTKAGYAR